MSNCKNVYIFVVGMSFFSLVLLVYKQTQDGIGGNSYLYSQYSSEAKMEPQLDTFEDRRCEGKVHMNPVPVQLTHRQYSRKKLLYEQCNDYSNLNVIGKWTTFDDIPHEELTNLLVDDRHGILYCYVPKVACTAWKRIMMFLSESLKVYGVPYKNAADIPIEDIHGSSLQHLNAYPKEVMKQKLETYQKFIFVRDPFVRLISAYRDKLENDNQVYYEMISKYILQQFGNVSDLPKSVKEARAQGMIPSFYNFIEYILSLPTGNNKLFDEHWRQTIHLCHPCLINYDFIGRMETIDEDAAHLLRILKVDNIVNFTPWIRNKTELSEIKKWFSNIPTDWRKKLYNIYKADFKLFGYKNHDNLEKPYLENVI